MSGDQRFFDFLKERIGLDVTSVGPAIIERAVRQRTTLSQAAHANEYWQLLQGSRDEQQALIEAGSFPRHGFSATRNLSRRWANSPANALAN
ncbi:methylase of chemotaxis methyl-accepting protein [Pseudomonas sp. GM16]|nr:methylase of chemotaxis methyl-accepting protein [Pseudomonas sp. GM16]